MSKVLISPGAEGAIEIQPPLGPAVKVFRKNDSPPKADFAILLRKPPTPPPPLIPVCTSKPDDCATIAPGSTLIDSPGPRFAVSSVNAGPNS